MKNKMLVFGLIGLLSVGIMAGVFTSNGNVSFADTPNSKVEQTEDKEKDSKEFEDEKNEAALDTNVILSETEATNIALNSIDPSAQVAKVELEDENGTIVYGVEITFEKKDYDIKVDANSGQILASDDDKDESINDKERDSDEQDNGQVEHENDNEDPEGYED